jgi:branched-chain amino acid transport system permease protein
MQVFLNGTTSGLTIALLAVGFAAVYVPTRVLFLALGAVYALVPYVVWTCLQRELPFAFAVAIGIGCGASLSMLCELANHRRLSSREAGVGAHLISSLGIYIVVVQGIVLAWGNEAKVLKKGLETTVDVTGATLTHAQLWVYVAAVVLLPAFFLLLRRSNVGLRFRALADNPVEFALRGHNVEGTRVLAFGIAGLFASASAILVANDLGFDPQGGFTALLLAIVATIVGGQSSFAGAVLGGVLLGVLRAEVVWYLSARWQEPVTFLVLIAFLFLRPGGLFGQTRRLEAES